MPTLDELRAELAGIDKELKRLPARRQATAHPRVALSFPLHVGMCGACRLYLQQMKSVIRTLGALPDTSPPPEVAEAREQRATRQGTRGSR